MDYPDAIVASVAVIAVFTLATVLVWQLFATVKVRAALKDERSYQELAQENTRLMLELTDQQKRITTELAETRTSVAAMERMMREVG
ncbi:hypothetical protein PJ985_03780 [Streptomyces sp. ACA25]|uniref:hypothetical protein n=1 Tax=Streptomyces sp. ACA25 TaxID=3022596 RepID=UPI00230737E3|nr:hypothetical protein [Streptomyces sp. ACA25]MDB1086687.1 hypothetical protein [Streptomyces sp. ACA25]